jgi:hypothetical protein
MPTKPSICQSAETATSFHRASAGYAVSIAYLHVIGSDLRLKNSLCRAPEPPSLPRIAPALSPLVFCYTETSGSAAAATENAIANTTRLMKQKVQSLQNCPEAADLLVMR